MSNCVCGSWWFLKHSFPPFRAHLMIHFVMQIIMTYQFEFIDIVIIDHHKTISHTHTHTWRVEKTRRSDDEIFVSRLGMSPKIHLTDVGHYEFHLNAFQKLLVEQRRGNSEKERANKLVHRMIWVYYSSSSMPISCEIIFWWIFFPFQQINWIALAKLPCCWMQRRQTGTQNAICSREKRIAAAGSFLACMH